MPSTATTRNRLEKQAPGENSNTWGNRFNQNFADLIDKSLDGMVSFDLSGSKTLTDEDFADDEARQRYINVTGGTGGTVTIPNVEKWYLVRNDSTGTLTFTTGTGTTATIQPGSRTIICCDGADECINLFRFMSGMDIYDTLNVGRDASGAGLVTLTGQAPGLTIKDSNASGAAATGYIQLLDSADAQQGRMQWGASNGQLLLAGAISVRLNNSTVDFPNITTTASAANAFLDSGASNRIYRSTSSLRYKQDVNDISDAEADLVMSLRPITYRSKAEADDPERVHWGFIAEEVAQIIPALVHYDGEGKPDGMQYERVIVGLLSVVKRLEARVIALES